MAEGGEYSSPVLGSDIVFEYTCTPCAEDGNIQESLRYCPECKEFLCEACVNHHKKVSATKKHNLQDNDFQRCEKGSIHNTSDEEHVFKCLYHPDRDIEMYCGDHDMVFCALCIAKNHRQCSGIQELEEAAKTIPVNKKELVLQIDSVQTSIQSTRQNKEANLIALDQEKNETLKTIENTELLIIDKVKALASDEKAKTCIKYDVLKKDIQDEESVLNQAITDTNELRDKIETQKELDTNQEFARHILQKYIISQTDKIHDDVEKEERKMKCCKNDELIQHVMTATCLVQIVGSTSSINAKDKSVSKMSQKEVIIKGDRDKQTCSIYGICQLSDGTILLADHANEKLKRLNMDFGIKDEFSFNSNPTGMCVTGKTEVAVKLKNNTILFVSIDKQIKKKHLIYIEGGKCIGLAFFDNKIWCYNGLGVTVYNRSGTVVKTFCHKMFDKTEFKPDSQYVFPVAAGDEYIHLTDYIKVACLDKEGNVWAVMKNERLKGIRRACISQNGIIFLAGYDSGNIMMFNEKGKCLGELVDNLAYPDSLFFDKRTHQLIVGHKDKNELTIISTDVC